MAQARLIITADDYGYAPGYDAGIVEAMRAGAIDAVSVMALRDVDPRPLLDGEVEIGLHLEPLDRAPLADQLARFETAFGRSPTHIDGHHHCHADGARTALAVARAGRRLGARVRSVGARHRRLLRTLRVTTNDHLVGRRGEHQHAMPGEIAALAGGEAPASGLWEWIVHPGRPDRASGSGYDAGRLEDLVLVLGLVSERELVRARSR